MTLLISLQAWASSSSQGVLHFGVPVILAQKCQSFSSDVCAESRSKRKDLFIMSSCEVIFLVQAQNIPVITLPDRRVSEH